MEKVYTRINWLNEDVSQTTPLGASNLNRMDSALDTIDNRVVTIDITKSSESEVLTMLADVTYNTASGQFTFTRKNGQQIIADLNIEKIPVDFSMDANGVIKMTTSDGSTYTADVGSLIKTYSFVDSTTIDFSVQTDASGNKNVTADVIDGSITENKLQPNFLADCVTAKNAAEAAATDAEASALEAKGYAQEAALGSGGNNLNYADNVLQLKRDDTVLSSVTIEGGQGVSDYTELENKPSINGVTLVGNKTTEDLLIEASSISGYETLADALADSSLTDGEYFSTDEPDETEPTATILDTVEDVMNNTEQNQIMGALVGKELLHRGDEVTIFDAMNNPNNQQTITYPNMLNEFRYIIFTVKVWNTNEYTTAIFQTSLLRRMISKILGIYGYGRFLLYTVTDENTFTFSATESYLLANIIGIK